MKNDEMKVLDEAFAAAKKATEDYLAKYPNDWFPCGFSWVELPGRSPLVKFLKKRNENQRGSKGYPKGWHIWNPSGNHTQTMYAKSAGVDAFCDVLRKHGYECLSNTRMD